MLWSLLAVSSKHFTIDLYGAGPTATACSASRRKSFSRLREFRRLKRNVNSSKQSDQIISAGRFVEKRPQIQRDFLDNPPPARHTTSWSHLSQVDTPFRAIRSPQASVLRTRVTGRHRAVRSCPGALLFLVNRQTNSGSIHESMAFHNVVTRPQQSTIPFREWLTALLLEPQGRETSQWISRGDVDSPGVPTRIRRSQVGGGREEGDLGRTPISSCSG
jgi:hypothetical protein